MKQINFFQWALWGILIGCFLSCQEENTTGPAGMLYLSVAQDETIYTKAQLEVTNELLLVDIISEEGDTVKHFNDFVTEVKDQKMILPLGNYSIVVRSNQSESAGWEMPFYVGTEDVTIKAGEITSAKVVCTIANTKVFVEYAEDLATYFSNYETTVSNSSGSLLYTRDEYRSGFFKPEKLITDLKLVNRDGNTFNLQRIFTDIKPQYFYKIRYSLDSGNGDDEAGADFGGIHIEEKADTVYYGIYIKQEDLYDKKPAVLTLEGFTDNKLVFKKTAEVVIPQNSLQVTSPNGIKQFRIEASSHQLKDELKSFDLCALSAEQERLLGQLNFPIQEIREQKEVTLDLTAFAKMLNPLTETELATHSFTAYVLDNLHQEVAISFAYEVRPDVAAYVSEPHCWTTFAVLSGNCLDETSYFKLQAEGDSEIAIKTITRDTEGNMNALVTGLIPGVNYIYWLVSEEDPEMTCNPVSFSTAVAMNIPNLNFENWSSRTGSSPTGSKSYITPNAQNEDVYWESGNLGAASASATLTSSVATPAIEGSSNAAQLKSTWAGVLGFGAFAAGSVYSGYPMNVTTSGATLSYGRPYQGYPSSLKGYYKYAPGTVDYYDSRTPADGLKKGDSDQCIIYIALCTKQYEIVSTTSNVTPFPKDDPTVFAYGEYISGTTEDRTGETSPVEIMNGYAPFKISLNYRTDVPKSGPFYVVIMASSSRSGDYFTGSTSSVMLIDELTLDYTYDAECFGGFNLSTLTPVKINE